MIRLKAPWLQGAALFITISSLFVVACSPQEYRQEADEVAYDAIDDAQETMLGETEPFTIEKPSDTLRRRLLMDQDLPYVGRESLGVQSLEPIPHWPDDDYLDLGKGERDDLPAVPEEGPLEIGMVEALKIAAASSRNYQLEKESVFRTALALDLERNEFRAQFFSFLRGEFQSDQGATPVFNAFGGQGEGRVNQMLKNGMELSMAMGVSIASLISGSGSSQAVNFDASIAIPLLRGSGDWVVAEPLVQAERDTLYAICDFERFKQSFVVDVASAYLRVLQAQDQVENAANNYKRNIIATRLSIALGEAGRLQDIEVDQARQNELRAQQSWIASRQNYASRMDQFKLRLGLPPDAEIELDREELLELAQVVGEEVAQEGDDEDEEYRLEDVPAGDDPAELETPTYPETGLLGLTERFLMDLAFENRKDLWVREGRVYDAQRRVTVAADRLGAELTLFGSARYGGVRSPGGATLPDTNLRFADGRYDAVLNLDLPLERTSERNLYRISLINLNDSVQSLQELEDTIKLSVRDGMRTLLEARESVRIQARAVTLAARRVESTELSLQAGRAQVRDVLDAQNDLLQSQNDLTRSVIDYRLAQLRLQRDAGVLAVDGEGAWVEFDLETVLAMTEEDGNDIDIESDRNDPAAPGITDDTHELMGETDEAVEAGGGESLVEPADARSVEETVEQSEQTSQPEDARDE